MSVIAPFFLFRLGFRFPLLRPLFWRSIVGLALFVLYLSVFLFFIPRLFPNRRIKRRCIITGKPLRYYRYRGSIMYGQDTFFAVNLDVCSYIPERGCAKFLNLTHPFPVRKLLCGDSGVFYVSPALGAGRFPERSSKAVPERCFNRQVENRAFRLMG